MNVNGIKKIKFKIHKKLRYCNKHDFLAAIKSKYIFTRENEKF